MKWKSASKIIGETHSQSLFTAKRLKCTFLCTGISNLLHDCGCNDAVDNASASIQESHASYLWNAGWLSTPWRSTLQAKDIGRLSCRNSVISFYNSKTFRNNLQRYPEGLFSKRGVVSDKLRPLESLTHTFLLLYNKHRFPFPVIFIGTLVENCGKLLHTQLLWDRTSLVAERWNGDM
jgi:hypothetical protein